MTSLVELQKTNPFLCAYPFNGLVVSPDGRLLACCHSPSRKNTLGRITEVDSLSEWFWSGPLHHVRNKLASNTGYPELPCSTCENWDKMGLQPHNHRTAKFIPWDIDNYNVDATTVRYLEYTPSNLCNQSCVMCGGVYSSKWWQIDKIAIQRDELRFRTKDLVNHRTKPEEQIQSLSDKDFEKIITCIREGVWKLYIKGGEPFADERNLELLERIASNEFPELRNISMSTNLARMTPRIVRIFEDIPKNTKVEVSINISIDGVGKQYEWVRSTPWEKLVENVRTIAPILKLGYACSMTMSMYNFFNIPDIVKGITSLPGHLRKLSGRVVTNPNYINPYAIATEEDVDLYAESHKN